MKDRSLYEKASKYGCSSIHTVFTVAGKAEGMKIPSSALKGISLTTSGYRVGSQWLL